MRFFAKEPVARTNFMSPVFLPARSARNFFKTRSGSGELASGIFSRNAHLPRVRSTLRLRVLRGKLNFLMSSGAPRRGEEQFQDRRAGQHFWISWHFAADAPSRFPPPSRRESNVVSLDKSDQRQEQREYQRFTTPRIHWALNVRKKYALHRNNGDAMCANWRALLGNKRRLHKFAKKEEVLGKKVDFIPSGRQRQRLARGDVVALCWHRGGSEFVSWVVVRVNTNTGREFVSVPVDHIAC